MLDVQRELQRKSFNVDPQAITASGDMSYIRDMVLAAISELNEVLGEVTWKPWVTTPPNVNVDSYKKEIVDVWHFLMNLMLAVDMSADELYELYMRKKKINADRQRNGYDGISLKCSSCQRALDDITLVNVRSPSDPTIIRTFCPCGELLSTQDDPSPGDESIRVNI